MSLDPLPARIAPGFPVRPLQDNVVVKLVPLETEKGGVVLVESDRKRRGSRRAVVWAVGPGHYVGCKSCGCTRNFVPTELNPGDIVIVSATAGDDFSYDLSAPRNNIAKVKIDARTVVAKGVEFKGGSLGSYELTNDEEWRVIREAEAYIVDEARSDIEREWSAMAGASQAAAE